MCAVIIGAGNNKIFEYLPNNFNKKKFGINYGVPHDELIAKMQNMSKRQCFSNKEWPEIKQIKAWMISAETATFMKCGGLGMVASELPENFNTVFGNEKHYISFHEIMIGYERILYLKNEKKYSICFNDEPELSIL